APVRLERYTPRSLNMRRLRLVRESTLLRRLLGIGGRVLPPVRRTRRPLPLTPSRLRRREEGEQDKVLGIAMVANAIETGAPCPIPTDFVLHVTELTLAIQAAGRDGACHTLTTTFAPFDPPV
ncbi:hypothetical protein, partial [Enterococcus faecalis]|uniref:hypothetical protein n=1 Tax=Enterococcus faecalis TaxID=1351 RepID=UPI00403F21DF